MSFNWAEYLSLAETLCGVQVSGPHPGVEAHHRASYVSAHNRLRDVDRVPIPALGNPHRFVADQYVNHPDLSRVQIGIELGRLRVARNRCDYDDRVGQLPSLWRRSLARAAHILTDLGRL
jgi:hypothetical protein